MTPDETPDEGSPDDPITEALSDRDDGLTVSYPLPDDEFDDPGAVEAQDQSEIPLIQEGN